MKKRIMLDKMIFDRYKFCLTATKEYREERTSKVKRNLTEKETDWPRTEFLNLSFTEIWRCCPLHYKMSSSILDLYPVDASSFPFQLELLKISADMAKCFGEWTCSPLFPH